MSKVHMPNLEKAFKFKITKSGGGGYRVDTCLPGMPLVGIGKTKGDAKYDLCMNWLYLIANYDGGHSGDNGYVPIILSILKEDMQKLGKKV